MCKYFKCLYDQKIQGRYHPNHIFPKNTKTKSTYKRIEMATNQIKTYEIGKNVNSIEQKNVFVFFVITFGESS